MRKITLSGWEMTTKMDAHTYLAKMLDFPSYYGRNLDALWDLLTAMDEPTEITIEDRQVILSYLGKYGEALLDVLCEAGAENPALTVIL